MIYIIYRWIIAIYFLSWFIASMLVSNELHGSKLIIFMTHWSSILLNVYLLSAATVTLSYFIFKHFYKKTPPRDLKLSDIKDQPFLEKPCCYNLHSNESVSIPWYIQYIWILYVVASEMSVEVSVGYWFTYEGEVRSWPVNLHEHLFNVIPGLIDLFVMGLPIRFYHFIYLMIVNLIYGLFTAIYYGAGGTRSDGRPYIYSPFNYEGRPVFASFSFLMLVFVLPPVLHSIYWGLYCLRTFILSRILKRASPDNRPSQSSFAIMSTSSSPV